MTARRMRTRRPSPDQIKAMTPEQRAANAHVLVGGLRGAALEHWIETGEGIREQLERSRSGWTPSNSQFRGA